MINVAEWADSSGIGTPRNSDTRPKIQAGKDKNRLWHINVPD